MNKIYLRKVLAIAVITLFIGLAVAPSINANIRKERMIRIPVTEYKEEGTIEKRIIKMSQSGYKELSKKLQNIRTPETKLSLYKEYGLIPQEVTLEQLKRGMEEKAQRFGLLNENIKTNFKLLTNKFYPSDDDTVIVQNYDCMVGGVVALGFRLYCGFSRITLLINRWIFIIFRDWDKVPPIKSKDIFHTGFVFMGSMYTKNGTLPDNGDALLLLQYLIINFVGYVVGLILSPLWFVPYYPRISGYEDYFGYAEYVYGKGQEFPSPR